MGSSIPLGSSRHRDTIVYSSLGPLQNGSELFEKRKEEEIKGRVEKDGEKEEKKKKSFKRFFGERLEKMIAISVCD